ncbi:ABC transporter ATP-binding protein [Mesorhizobium sp. PAMC28654]|uniref:dipeptide ABC transporter ATP-binding protein n=1 Tax=Mesorhizobium sp. PAMC28654 TaxID=2880934 RepID=UPI001D0B8A42|nr:ABC transporter ATP-binding protein [Mesorhizobium sp. PAMC28654]UDL92033.1 ABC transporter ATP-binding protein [Mesorhizobium sp. PAMC28654]
MTMTAPERAAMEPGHGVPLLDIQDLRIEFRGKQETVVAVPKLSFSVMPGESYGLVGESGCGKSTTAMAIMGYLGATGVIAGGSIRLEGEELVGTSARKLRAMRGRRIAMVYQDPMSALNPVKTVGAQLAEVPMLHLGATRAEATDMAAAMLKDVRLPDPGDMLKRYPHQLSGGQQQRVVIAMALLGRPALLLLDEPTTGLDVTVEAAVIDLIAELRRRYRTSLLFISHNLGLIAESCDRVGIMYSGEMVEEAPTRELFKSPRHPYTQGLIDCIPDIGAGKHSRTLAAIPGQIPLPGERPQGCLFGPRCASFRKGICDDHSGLPLETAGERHLVRCVRWQEVARARPTFPTRAVDDASTVAAIEVVGVSKLYNIGFHKTLKANEAVSFAAAEAEIVALVGESGCGKSTLARIVAGLDRATSGEIRVAGQNIATLGASRRSRHLLQSIQMIFQNPDSTLNPSHSAGFSIRRSLKKFGISKGRAAIDARMRELLEMVRLPADFARRKPNELSGGQKQRIAIARAFAANPSLIIADEPVSALDVSVQAAIVTLLLDIQKNQRSTMLFISHDLALVRHVADKVVVMYLGKVMERGTVDEIFGGTNHPYTQALISAVRSTNLEEARTRITLTGETPSPVEVPPGCRFASRCHRKVGAICDTVPPPVQRMSDTHEIACHIPLEGLQARPATSAAPEAQDRS